MSVIPKQIHYCWFGGKKKSAKVKECIESWRKICPDYKITEWNETNFDITQNAYTLEAYNSKYYAFCSDYARLWIVYNYGGIYLDTDVELIKSLDQLLQYNAFFATEDGIHISTGLGYGATPQHSLVKSIMQDYENIHFMTHDSHRKTDKTPCPKRNTKIIKDLYPDLNLTNYAIQDNIAFLPKEYFCPLDYETHKLNITDNTYGIHWFSASWMRPSDKIKKHLRQATKKAQLHAKRLSH